MTISDRFDRAKSRFEKFGKSVSRKMQSPESEARHKDARALLEKGRKRYNDRDYSAAEESFREAVHVEPRYVKAYYFLGLALYKLDDAEGAVRAWQRAVDINPRDDMAYKSERKIAYVQKRMDKTIGELEERLKG